MKRLQIVVSGRVQGVFFRATAKRVADQLSLMGMVQNLPNGSVYIDIQGDDEKVNEFLNWCYQGPDMGRVDKVEFTMEEDLKEYSGFDIVR